MQNPYNDYYTYKIHDDSEFMNRNVRIVKCVKESYKMMRIQ